MILEELTFKSFGYNPSQLKSKSGKKIICSCDLCGKIREVYRFAYTSNCLSCSIKQAHADGKLATLEIREKLRTAQTGRRYKQNLSHEQKRKKSLNNKRENNPRWKNGTTHDSYGYTLILDPSGKAGKYIKEHRFVMSEHLGRPLLKTEVVHHKNGIRHDNRIENLELFSSTREHSKHHQKYN